MQDTQACCMSTTCRLRLPQPAVFQQGTDAKCHILTHIAFFPFSSNQFLPILLTYTVLRHLILYSFLSLLEIFLFASSGYLLQNMHDGSR